MDTLELLFRSNELVALLCSTFVVGIVQVTKKKGHDPFFILAILSLAIAFLWSAVNQLVPKEVITKGSAMVLEIAAFANLIYNVAKTFTPRLLNN